MNDEIKLLFNNRKVYTPGEYGTINILGLEYSIILQDMQSIGLSSFNFGRHIPSECVILINNMINPQQMKATLYHEVLHVILEAIGENDLNKNEDFVEKLSRALLQTFDIILDGVINNIINLNKEKDTK